LQVFVTQRLADPQTSSTPQSLADWQPGMHSEDPAFPLAV
jgi:hypothetical protein